MRILADDHACRNTYGVIDDASTQPRAPTDVTSGSRTDQLTLAYEWTRQEENSSERFISPEMMQPPETVDSMAIPCRSIWLCDKLGWRQLRLVRPDRPVLVVKIERRIGRRQVNVGLPICINRTRIAPVVLFPGRSSGACTQLRLNE